MEFLNFCEMSPFRFESSCARDGGMWWIILQRKGGAYLIVGVRGILLPRVILRRERHHDHIWISNFFVTSVPGCRGYVLIWHMGGICPYIGPSTPPQVFFWGGTKTEHTLLLSTITLIFLSVPFQNPNFLRHMSWYFCVQWFEAGVITVRFVESLLTLTFHDDYL